jgi:hypothetical protein
VRHHDAEAISCFDRPDAATAVRAMNDGAKPRLTNANAPFSRKTRRDTISNPSRFQIVDFGFQIAKSEF